MKKYEKDVVLALATCQFIFLSMFTYPVGLLCVIVASIPSSPDLWA